MATQGPRAVLRFIARSGKRVGVSVAGFALLLAGGIMLVTPGPGVVVILVGLAVLASEYAWAERMLDRVKNGARGAANRIRRPRRQPEG